MGLNCGIVGLPNVGKSTIFSALTAVAAEAANYPFCTINPNVGIVTVPDERLKFLTQIFNPKKVSPAIVEFVDIAGLVKGASKGEGLGNQFLGHIRQVGAIIHVVRCFDDTNITHVSGKIDPLDDMSTIHLELALADLETIEKRLSNLDRMMRGQDKEAMKKAKLSRPILERFVENIHKGIPLMSLPLDPEDREVVSDLHLLSLKKQLYVCNVDEASYSSSNHYVKQVEEYAKSHGCEVLTICGQIEKEISLLESEEEKKEFMEGLGLAESGLNQIIRTGYQLLGLQTFFTVGEQEVRAWTFDKDMKAPQTAGVIHTDFERGFIKAEVYHYDDLVQWKSEPMVKEKGKLRIEGKEYVVKDGDIMFFRFNV